MERLADRIVHLLPCAEAIKWLGERTDAETAWRECQRADWMIWLLARLVSSPTWSEDRKPLLACTLDCAETSKGFWPSTHRFAMETAVQSLRDWIDGKVDTLTAHEAGKNLRVVAASASDASTTYATVAAITSVTYSVCVASRLTNLGFAAISTIDLAAEATGSMGKDYRPPALYANIVRRHFPSPPIVTKPES